MMKKLKLKLKQKLSSESLNKTNEQKLFLENGGIFLEKLIADCNGISIPIRNFSSSQILKATNHFDSKCLVNDSWGAVWYKGIIEYKPYLIKRFTRVKHGEAFNDIVLSARMSNHNNFLKVIGCCFEFSSIVVVLEYAKHGCLNSQRYVEYRGVNGEEYKIFPWSVRLKIAKEVAVAVTYLHTTFPRIIIHREITPENIFLDKNWKAKLTDFTFSVSLPKGKSRIKDTPTFRSIWYTDPLYLATHSLSEYTDVYSFGVCLLVFFTGKSPYDFYKESYIRSENMWENQMDPVIAKDITSDQKLQVEAFLMLALRCCAKREENRPKMIQVAKELKRIEQIK